jgi:glycosyltransferase involved in cell wall biosynthesis
MTHTPLVSIVLPTHNGGAYLDQAVQSCLDQTWTNWELVIVDDASTDDTPERIARWIKADRRIRCARHFRNRRLPAALNTGFTRVSGDLLTWTSDDNLFRPHALAEMVAFLQAHPDVDVVYTDYSEINDAGQVVRHCRVSPVEELAVQNCIGPSFLYRRAVHERVGGYAEDLFLAEDYDFWLRASEHHQLERLAVDCYLYRVHAGSLTARRARDIEAARAQAQFRNLARLHWMGTTTKAHAYLSLGLRLCRTDQVYLGRFYLRRAFGEFRILEHDPEFAMRELLYERPGVLRNSRELAEMVEALPQDLPRVKGLIKRVWGRYHQVCCFEGYRDKRPEVVRRHLPRAVWLVPPGLGNRGLLRIGLWGYTHRD